MQKLYLSGNQIGPSMWEHLQIVGFDGSDLFETEAQAPWPGGVAWDINNSGYRPHNSQTTPHFGKRLADHLWIRA